MNPVRLKVPPRVIWQYNRANWDCSRELLSNLSSEVDDFINLSSDELVTELCIPSKLVDHIWSNWCSEFFTIMKNSIPQKKVSKHKNMPWIQGDLLHDIKKRNRLFKKAKRTNKECHWTAYRLLRNSITVKLRQAKRDYFAASASTGDSKDMWSAYKTLTKSESYPSILKDGDVVAETPAEKASMFNRFFARCFDSNDIHPDFNRAVDHLFTLGSINCTSDEIIDILTNMDIKTAAGPDGISARMLKESMHQIVPFLVDFFNLCFDLGCFPSIWKHSNVVPIFKSKDRSSVSNYRPISLQCLTSKIMEKIVHNHLFMFLVTTDRIPSNQFGFISGRSTGDALVTAVEDWFCALDRDKTNVAAVFFDLSKAFDKVSHALLTQQLYSVGVCDTALHWFSSYLSDRTQSVIVQGASSSSVAVTSGVPQGSILGPLLFILFTSDINSLNFTSNMIMYADDILIYKTISSVSDLSPLQLDCDKIAHWVNSKKLVLNVDKTKFMLVSNRHNFLPDAHVYINNNEIERVTTFKYLGVTLSDKLSWSIHINNITKQARKLLGFLYRSFYKTNPDLIFTFYKTVVRPILDYNCLVWNPHLSKDIQKLEGVQKFALRMTSRDWSGSYATLCNMFNVPTLADRRKYFILTYCFKYLNSGVYSTRNLFTCKARINPRLDHPFALERFRVRTTSRLNFLTYSAIIHWNALPTHIVSAHTVMQFKGMVKRYIF